MTMRNLVQTVGLCGVAALGIFSIVASVPINTQPAAPTMVSLEIPASPVGTFAGVTPAIAATTSVPATYFVLPLVSNTAPIVHVLMQAPYPSDLVVSVVDNTRGGSAVPLPLVSTGSGPSTGYFQIIKLVPNDWTIVIRYPNSFQGSKSISTSIADKVSSGAVSAPLTYNMSFSGSTVSVFRMTTNGDGRITSDPPGIDCPGTCTFDFRGFSSVKLMQSVTHNMTEFIGWTGNCTGMGDCLLQLLEPGPAIIPVNPTATANFRIHVNGGIPSSMSCPAAPLIAGKRWSGQPNCGSPPPLGATLQCDAQGYFCCGPSGGNNSPRCNGGNQTAATCGADSLGVFGTNQQLIQPGGCYEAGP